VFEACAASLIFSYSLRAGRQSRALLRAHHIGIEAVEHFEYVGGAERKPDACHIFLNQFHRVDPDHFAARIQQRAPLLPGLIGASV